MSLFLTDATYDRTTGAVHVWGTCTAGVGTIKGKIEGLPAADAAKPTNTTWDFTGTAPGMPPYPATVSVTIYVPGVPGKDLAIDIDSGLLAALAGVGVDVQPGLVGTRLTLRSAPAAT